MFQNKYQKNGVSFDASPVAIIHTFDITNHLVTDMSCTSIISFFITTYFF